MKRINVFMCMLLLLTIIVGCSSDDEDVTAIYHLLDINGQETTVFNSGDDIVFELIVINSTNHTLKYADERDFINGAFIVYNSEGQLFNPILADDLMIHPVSIPPGEQFKIVLQWPWLKVPLPIGKYSSTCTLNIDEKRKNSYSLNFEIR